MECICLHCHRSSRTSCNKADPMCAFFSTEHTELVNGRHTTICHHCDSYPCVCGARENGYEMLESTPEPKSVPSVGDYLWACTLNGDEKAKKQYEEYEEQRRLNHMINNRDGRIL